LSLGEYKNGFHAHLHTDFSDGAAKPDVGALPRSELIWRELNLRNPVQISPATRMSCLQ
jgi:hypothetical protein